MTHFPEILPARPWRRSMGRRRAAGAVAALATLLLLVPLIGVPTRLAAQQQIPPTPPAPTGMAARLIEALKMQRIPQEGPWFALNYVSTDELPAASLPARYGGGSRKAGSAIYALETHVDFSALHRLQTDEIWHYYGGNPLELLLLYPDGHGETVVLGPDVLHGQKPQFVVPRGVWQGSSPLGEGPDAYTLFGDTLAPGFDYTDFEIGYRDELQQRYPAFAERIARLTRGEFSRRPAK